MLFSKEELLRICRGISMSTVLFSSFMQEHARALDGSFASSVNSVYRRSAFDQSLTIPETVHPNRYFHVEPATIPRLTVLCDGDPCDSEDLAG